MFLKIPSGVEILEKLKMNSTGFSFEIFSPPLVSTPAIHISLIPLGCSRDWPSERVRGPNQSQRGDFLQMSVVRLQGLQHGLQLKVLA